MVADYKLAQESARVSAALIYRINNLWPGVPEIIVPLQYMCWVNLLYNQLVMPQASFSGHMSGILAGLVHVFLPKAGSPLKIHSPSCIAN